MKKTIIICLAALLFGLTSANAQGILDKVDRALDKADRAANSADRAGKTGSKVGGLLGKKKDKNAERKTILRVNGITFSALKSLNDNVQNGKGVVSTKMKFSDTVSTIMIQHSGSTEDLLKILQKVSPAIFAEKNIESFGEGEIAVKLK